MTASKYKFSSNVVYTCKYHVVWCSKYGRKVLTQAIQKDLAATIDDVCSEKSCEILAISKDSLQKIAKTPKSKKKKNGKFRRSIRFGKSVQEASHYQLRQMPAYKCWASGRQYIEVDSKYTTMTCSTCGARDGPTGEAGLSVRAWECMECIGYGALHDRDKNSAINILKLGLGISLERVA